MCLACPANSDIGRALFINVSYIEARPSYGDQVYRLNMVTG
jgi:hypothetical protein